MVKFVADRTGRFSQRPHYEPKELDRECEKIICDFLRSCNGQIEFPISTDDLTKLLERDTQDLDLFANLENYGPTVEGLTAFHPGSKPSVKISVELSADTKRENRLRTTLTHEYGHARFHSYLWDLETQSDDLLGRGSDAHLQICKRDTIVDAAQTDWMEWQAGYICGALLMPASYARKLAASYFQANNLFGVVAYDSPHGIELIELLQRQFSVSSMAAKVRLAKLGILGPQGSGPSLFQ